MKACRAQSQWVDTSTKQRPHIRLRKHCRWGVKRLSEPEEEGVYCKSEFPSNLRYYIHKRSLWLPKHTWTKMPPMDMPKGKENWPQLCTKTKTKVNTDSKANWAMPRVRELVSSREQHNWLLPQLLFSAHQNPEGVDSNASKRIHLLVKVRANRQRERSNFLLLTSWYRLLAESVVQIKVLSSHLKRSRWQVYLPTERSGLQLGLSTSNDFIKKKKSLVGVASQWTLFNSRCSQTNNQE